MDDIQFKILKDRIKKLARKKGKTLNDIFLYWNITPPGFDRRIKSDNFPYSKNVHDLAGFLECSVSEILLLPESKQESKQEVLENEIKEPVELYHKNNDLDEKTLLHVLKSENLLLQQIIERQEKDIDFLRAQLAK